ncbi:MAG: hypothetical protein KF861_13560 [Planctomycetaceae bacterium]|nr:hypothetical protein [Planctomycetaceae bacterium]
MSEAYLSVRHLLRQLDERRSNRSRGLQLPRWLERFIEEAAAHFEPETDAARVGYFCSCVAGGWQVALFLGAIEIVGGPEDGASFPSGFHFDLEALRDQFDRVDQITWKGLPQGCAGNDSDIDEASVVVEGVVNGHGLQLQVMLRPPGTVGAGLLMDANGHVTPAP